MSTVYNKKRNMVVEVVIFLYVCLMLYTAIEKLIDYNMTREQMALMPLLTPIAHVIVWLLPTTEMVIAVLLFIPRYRKIGLSIVTALMVSFTVYIAYMMVYYKHLPCSCGGLLQELSWKGHLIFNISFIIAGLIALRLLRIELKNEVEKVVKAIS